MAEQPAIQVTLCWSLAPRHVHEMTLQVPAGSAVQAVLRQGMAQCVQAAKATNADADADAAQLQSLPFLQPGIWGRKVPWTHVVQAGDRIELYRPLKVDPKVARRQRFKRQGKGRTGLFANRKSGSAAGY
jgi:putative ubiquitin-RnfH superfamily antitoxin RatB of RatAB toxin-antitoxin module